MSKRMEQLELLLEEISMTVNSIEEAQFQKKPSPEKWSKLEGETVLFYGRHHDDS